MIEESTIHTEDIETMFNSDTFPAISRSNISLLNMLCVHGSAFVYLPPNGDALAFLNTVEPPRRASTFTCPQHNSY